MDIKTARERLAAAEDKEPNCTCPSPEDFHEEGCPWLYWMYEIPKATAALAAGAAATLAALILAVEALEASRNKFRHAADYLVRNHPADKNDALLARALRQDAREIDKALAAWKAL